MWAEKTSKFLILDLPILLSHIFMQLHVYKHKEKHLWNDFP